MLFIYGFIKIPQYGLNFSNESMIRHSTCLLKELKSLYDFNTSFNIDCHIDNNILNNNNNSYVFFYSFYF